MESKVVIMILGLICLSCSFIVQGEEGCDGQTTVPLKVLDLPPSVVPLVLKELMEQHAEDTPVEPKALQFGEDPSQWGPTHLEQSLKL